MTRREFRNNGRGNTIPGIPVSKATLCKRPSQPRPLREGVEEEGPSGLSFCASNVLLQGTSRRRGGSRQEANEKKNLEIIISDQT